jgi:hypothetical protein
MRGQARLGGKDDRISPSPKHVTDDALCQAVAVSRRGVDVAQPQIHGQGEDVGTSASLHMV